MSYFASAVPESERLRTTVQSGGGAAVSLMEAYEHLRLDTLNEEDANVSNLLQAATRAMENKTGWALSQKTYAGKLDRLPRVRNGRREVRLPHPPANIITSITYIDADDQTQTMSTDLYTLDNASVPGRVIFDTAVGDLTFADEANVITITYTAGYASGDVPADLRAAVLLMVGHWFENPEASTARRVTLLPLGVESLLSEYQLPRV